MSPLGRVASLGLDGRIGSSPFAGPSPRPSPTPGARSCPAQPPSSLPRPGTAPVPLFRDPLDVPSRRPAGSPPSPRAGGRDRRPRRHRRRGPLRRHPGHGGRHRARLARRRFPDALGAALDVLNRTDVAIVQHEYGLYGGVDGQDVITVLAALDGAVDRRRAHRGARTHLQPAARARSGVRPRATGGGDDGDGARVRLSTASTSTRRRRSLIPHGAGTPLADRHGPSTAPPAGRRGCSPGACSARARASSGPSTRSPRSATCTPGRVRDRRRHPPEGARHSGEAYREMLVRRARRADATSSVSFDDTYRDLASLTDLIHSADLVVLPYDSADQVTSGVLVDAVAAGRPVVATAFPHAVELLGSGAGIVVPQRDPGALADAIRAVLTDRGLAASMAAEARRLAPELVVEPGGRPVRRPSPRGSSWPDPESDMMIPSCPVVRPRPRTDRRHRHVRARRSRRAPSRARVLHRRRGAAADRAGPRARPGPALLRSADPAFRFLTSQEPTGRIRNRRDRRGRWQARARRRGLLGRSVWAFGTRPPAADRVAALDRACDFDRGAGAFTPSARRWCSPRSAPPRCSRSIRHPTAGERCWRTRSTRSGVPAGRPRMALARAAAGLRGPAVAEALIAAGDLLGRPEVVARVSRCSLAPRARDGRRAPVPDPGRRGRAGDRPRRLRPAADRGRGDGRRVRVGARGDRRRSLAARARVAVAWFLGDNDRRRARCATRTGGGYDGLDAIGAEPQPGAESTLAMTRRSSTRGVAFCPVGPLSRARGDSG